MMSKDIRKLKRMGKRRFIKNLSTLGFSATTLNFITQKTFAEEVSNIDNEITYVSTIKREVNENGELVETPVYNTVDREQWVRYRGVTNATQNLGDQIESTVGSRPAIARRSEEIAGEEQIIVQYPLEWENENNRVSYGRLEEILPDTVTGEMPSADSDEEVPNIPVILQKVRRGQESCTERDSDGETSYYNCEYRPVPGGANFEHGTLACRGYSTDEGQNVVLASGHGLKGAWEDGDNPTQPIDGGRIGEFQDIEFWHPEYGDDNMDFGYFPCLEDTSGKLADHDGYSSNWVEGIKTWDWLNNDAGDTTIIQQGGQTAQTSGKLWGTENDDGQKVFWQSANTDGGDSGGPHFIEEDGDYYIVGVHAWGRYNETASKMTSDDGVQSGGNCSEIIEDTADILIHLYVAENIW